MNSEQPQVSIRCYRHKKRFNVSYKWAHKICAWLCPKCYNKLSEEERQNYHPKGEPEIREAVRILPNPEVVEKAPDANIRSSKKSSAKPKAPLEKKSDRFSNMRQLPTDHIWPHANNMVSLDFIKTATLCQLQQAVRAGRLSRIRARMEVLRRRKAAYFDMLPAEEGVRFGY